MDRRNFVKTSLAAAGGALAAAAAGYGSESPAPAADLSGKAKGQYIRPDIPSFHVPVVRGQRYEDRVPDTLDIAERAKLCIHALTSITDARADYEVYWLATFLRNPPTMAHNFSDWVENCEGMMEALPLLRVATGSSENDHVDPVWMQVMLKKIGPDGLVYVPLKRFPWTLISISSTYTHPVWTREGSQTDVHAPGVHQIASPVTCERAISTLAVYYERDKNPMWKSAIEKMIQRLSALAVEKGDYAYFPGGALQSFGKFRAGSPMPIGFKGEETNGRLMQGLGQYYRMSGYEPARRLAGKLANYLRYQSQYYDPRGPWLISPQERGWWKDWHIENVVYGGHGHAHTIGLLSALEYAAAAGDQETLEFVRSAYEWAKANASPSVGFFPEAFLPHYTRCESGTIADMIAMALKLSAAGAGDYWDDADRWTRNHFAASQLTSSDWIYELAERSPRKPVAWNETGDHVPERSIGAFAGWSTANEFNSQAPGIAGTPYPNSIQHCCTGNCSRTVYYLWEHILNYHRGHLRVNLLLNRASTWADIYSHIPYAGKVQVKVKKPIESLRVRMPEWIETHSGTVAAQANGQRRPFRWEGRYLNLGSARPGEMIEVSFPIPLRRRKETIGDVTYTLEIKGNTVVSLDPPGDKVHGQLYQRASYLTERAPVRKVERFVPEEPIDW
jgi:hypothetical protein